MIIVDNGETKLTTHFQMFFFSTNCIKVAQTINMTAVYECSIVRYTRWGQQIPFFSVEVKNAEKTLQILFLTEWPSLDLLRTKKKHH